MSDGRTPASARVKFFLCSPAQVTANSGDCSTNGTQVGRAKTLDANGRASRTHIDGSTTPNDNTPREVLLASGVHAELRTTTTSSPARTPTATTECFTVIKDSPSIKTQASETGNGVVGTDSTSDSATVSGGDSPGGSIQFSITDPNGHKTDVGSPVTGQRRRQLSTLRRVCDLTLVGTYTWSASYSGDSLNNGAVDNGDNESVDVDQGLAVDQDAGLGDG